MESHPACLVCGSPQQGARWTSTRLAERRVVLWCDACGFGWLHPAPLPPGRAATPGGAVKPTLYVIQDEAEKERAFRIRLRKLEKLLPDRGRLLDVGSGLGHFLRIAKSAGWDVTGVEPNRGHRAYCRDHAGIEALEGLDQVQEGYGLFDTVTLWDVWEHVDEPLRFLDRCVRLLRPGGILTVAVPNGSGLPARMLHGEWRYVMDGHLSYFRPEFVRRMLAEHQLRIELEEHTLKIQSLAHGLASVFHFPMDIEKAMRLGRSHPLEEGRPEQDYAEHLERRLNPIILKAMKGLRTIAFSMNQAPIPFPIGDLMEFYARKP